MNITAPEYLNFSSLGKAKLVYSPDLNIVSGPVDEYHVYYELGEQRHMIKFLRCHDTWQIQSNKITSFRRDSLIDAWEDFEKRLCKYLTNIV